MKLKITILSFILIWTSCKSQMILIEESIVPKIEPGKCYFAVQSNTPNPENIDFIYPFRFSNLNDANTGHFHFEKGYILRVTEPVYKRTKRKLTADELKNIDWTKEKHTIQTTPPSIEMVIRNEELVYGIKGDWEAGLMICFIEIPGTHKTFATQQLKDKNFSFFHQKREKRIIEKIYVNEKPKNLKSNEWYLKEGYWSEFREYTAPPGCYWSPSTLVPRRLIELGYQVKDDETIDEEDVIALEDFQKKNGLPGEWGLMSVETLRKLGVISKKGTYRNLPFYKN